MDKEGQEKKNDRSTKESALDHKLSGLYFRAFMFFYQHSARHNCVIRKPNTRNWQKYNASEPQPT